MVVSRRVARFLLLAAFCAVAWLCVVFVDLVNRDADAVLRSYERALDSGRVRSLPSGRLLVLGRGF